MAPKSTPKKSPKNTSSVSPNAPTTGHSWDGIEEYNNPLPLWWLWVWAVCILFSIGYVIYFPFLPGGTAGASGWTSLKRLDAEIAAGKQGKESLDATLEATDLHNIQPNPELLTYATAAGKALFANNCSQCHGAGGSGVKGYPNLLDDEWLFGGSLDDIATTITHGVRNSTDPEARQPAPMPAFGRDEVLTATEIQDVANYLSVLAYGYAANESTTRGQEVFANNCTSCHGEQGEGMRDMGAPPLNNGIWQHAPTMADRLDVLHNGRASIMPAWGQILSPLDVKKLAIYVYSLGGGESAAPTPAPMPIAAPAPAAEPTPALGTEPAPVPVAEPAAAPAI
ncbi:MAG: cytochrome-c oxidase, cbb3-type subunit III [Alphaproteobacteria bacterium]